MMRSLFSGVSGLRTHQTKMDVIGNNIANVNTTAYKSSSITFTALMSQTTQRASGANAATGTGGVNARQIGLGVRAGAINLNITGQGSSQSTGNPFDVMINGENFFVVSDGSTNYFTRDGSFYVDGAGNLAMTSLGYNVMGWKVDPETGGIKKDTVSALRIMSAANMTYPPEATSEGYMSGIIDRHDTEVTSANGRVVNFEFYDSLGYSYTAKFVFRQSSDDHVYSLELDKVIDSEGVEVPGMEGVFGGTNKKIVDQEPKSMGFNLGNYGWNNGGNGSILQDTQTPPNNLVDLTQLIDNNVFRARDEVITIDATATPPVTATVEEQLEKVAAAYGYPGDVDGFLNQVYTDGNGVEWTVEQMLLRQGGATVNYAAGAAAPNLNSIFAAPDPTEPNVLAATMTGRSFQGYEVRFDAKNGNFAGIDGLATQTTVTLNLAGVGDGNFNNITLDLSETGMWDNKGTSTIGANKGSNEDDRLGQGSGRRLGDMIGVSIQQNGMIYASYDNGMTKLLGQIATARFANASGLEKLADNLYTSTLNSGEFNGIGVDITESGDSMSTGQLEMSNVDLSSEFTEMITTQRGFQANSRIITVSDTLLEELTNLKR